MGALSTFITGRGRSALVVISLWGITGCTAHAVDGHGQGQFATDEVQDAIAAAVADDGLVAMSPDPARPAGTGSLTDTYLAARVLEDRARTLMNDTSSRSMAQAVARADERSPVESTTARLMRARILHEAGQLEPAERADALRRYSALRDSGCPAALAASCVSAVDAVTGLTEEPPPRLTVAVPEDLPRGSQGAELVYQALSHGQGIANVDDWVRVARNRGLEPLSDAGDTSQPVSVRMWAASARSVLHHELGSGEEQRVQDAIGGLTSCAGVDRLAVGDRDTGECGMEFSRRASHQPTGVEDA